jgi:hypothetical protein
MIHAVRRPSSNVGRDQRREVRDLLQLVRDRAANIRVLNRSERYSV